MCFCLLARPPHTHTPTHTHTPIQVELPAGSARVTSVSCGGSHTLAVDDQKRALCCGKNEHGRLGLGPGAWKNKLTFEVGFLQLNFLILIMGVLGQSINLNFYELEV